MTGKIISVDRVVAKWKHLIKFTLVRSNGLKEHFSAWSSVITWRYIVQEGWGERKKQIISSNDGTRIDKRTDYDKYKSRVKEHEGNRHVTLYLHISHWQLCCKASCCCSLRQSQPIALLNQQANFLLPYRSISKIIHLISHLKVYQHQHSADL